MNPLMLYLRRDPDRSTDQYTAGRLFLDECGFLCDTLEDRDRGLTQDMDLDTIKAIKVYGETAIPKGTYEVRMDRVSPALKNRAYAKKYGGCLPYLVDVPGFDGILMHPFNSATECRGCIGPGDFVPETGRLKFSTRAFYDLMDCFLIPAKKRGQKIYIQIT